MEENPADQPAEPPQYECVVGVTSRPDVQMEEYPAYQPAEPPQYECVVYYRPSAVVHAHIIMIL